MKLMVMPKPQSVIFNETAKNYEFNKTVTITLPKNRAEFLFCAELLAEELTNKLCRAVSIINDADELLEQVADISFCPVEGLKDEEYSIDVGERGIFLEASSRKAFLYAVQTLRQLLVQFGASIPFMEIRDYPRFPLRGFYHDITRGRVPKLDTLKQMADKLMYYKINHLQLYVEHSYLFSFFPELCEADDFLTADEIRELDSYCREREIELVPSLASFGHLYHLLRTPRYAHLCELPNQENVPFSFWGRMSHHTIDVSNSESLELILKMTDEYMSLFGSKYYNLCGDETFDLGKGRSKKLADEIGSERMYLDFVKKLCEHLVAKGKIPMFWGDVIGAFPESIKELPEETVCLNWGYDANVSDESSRKLYAAGAKQLLCPGANGWNRLVNDYGIAYENISKMCSYADKYDAGGILTTDWGDYGHINNPQFSIPCMIYGAECSWNSKKPSKEDIDERISIIEFHDESGQIMHFLSEINPQTCLSWFHTVLFVQGHIDGIDVTADIKTIRSDRVKECRKRLEEIELVVEKLQKQIEAACVCNLGNEGCCAQTGLCLTEPEREELVTRLKAYRNAIDGIVLLNEIGLRLAGVDRYTNSGRQLSKRLQVGEELHNLLLSEKLHSWYREYSVYWRKCSKESELYRIGEIVEGLTDRLTGK